MGDPSLRPRISCLSGRIDFRVRGTGSAFFPFLRRAVSERARAEEEPGCSPLPGFTAGLPARAWLPGDEGFARRPERALLSSYKVYGRKKASAAAQQWRISLLCVGFVRVEFLIVGTGSGLLVYCYPKNRDVTRGECLPCTSFARPLKLSVTLPSGLPEIERCFEVLSIVPDKQEWWLGT